jgi:undecaprenyl-diphosphatase
MHILAWLLLGLVQGLTEFLPVSSSGHLLLLRVGLHLPAPPLTLELLLHVGTALAVLVAYRREWGQILCALASQGRGHQEQRGKALQLALAFVATAAVAALLEQAVRPAFSNFSSVAWGFLGTAVLLLTVQALPAGTAGMTLPKAAIIGCLQGVASFPGLSRSGTTIATALLLGVDPKTSARFSFLLSVPTVLLASAADLVGGSVRQVPLVPALVACAVSFAVGLWALRWTERLVARHKLWPFALYTGFLAAMLLAR